MTTTLHIDLSDIPPEKSQLFLDHLRVEVPASQSFTITNDKSNDRIQEDFFSEVSFPDGSRAEVEFCVQWDAAGRVQFLSADGTPGVRWRGEVDRWVRQALLRTLESRTERFFTNNLFGFMGSPLVGEYRFGGRRLVQLSPSDDRLRIAIEHAVLLSCWVDAPDLPRAQAIGSLRSDDFMSVLGCLLGVGFYRFQSERRWVRAEDGTFSRLPLTFEPIAPLPDTMPRRGELCDIGEFVAPETVDFYLPAHLVHGSKLSVWSDTRRLLRSFDALKLQDSKRFLRACRLFRIALTAGRNITTLRIAYQVAALDSLMVGVEPGQRSFVDFVCGLAPNADETLVRHAYSRIRSAHFHSGRLLNEDIGQTLFFVAPFMGEHKMESWLRLERVLWEALTNWLRGRDDETQPDPQRRSRRS